MSEPFNLKAAQERMAARRIVFGKSGHVRVDSPPRGRQLAANKFRITMTRDGQQFVGEGTTWRRAWETAHYNVSWYVVRANRKKGK